MNQRRARTVACTLRGGLAAIWRARCSCLDDRTGRSNRTDDPHRGRFRSRKKAPGERHFRREAASAAEMEQSPEASTAEPARCFGDLKTCLAIGNDQVAFESDTYTQSHHDPVYGCNDRLRLRQSSEKIGRVSIRLLWTAKSIELRNGSDLSFADVGPARKTGP